MRFCDHHGWRWDPGQGPSPCMGETMSFWLALGFLGTATIWANKKKSNIRSGWWRYSSPNTLLQPYQYDTAVSPGQSAGWESARRTHRAQVALSLVQAGMSLANGLLCARPEGMLCAALVLHTLGWTCSWLVSASELRRNPRLSKAFLWWWLAGAISNSVVLSSLHHSSRRAGHGMPGEIAALTWFAFLADALLVVLEVSKPELPEFDVASVYLLAADREGVPVASGWQAFWGGDEPLEFSSGGAEQGPSNECCCCGLRSLVRWFCHCCCCCCCCGQKAGEEELRTDTGSEGGAWLIGGRAEASGTLNDTLLGDIGIGLGRHSDRHALLYPVAKGKQNGRRNEDGCVHRTGNFLSSLVGRGCPTAEEAGEESLRRQELDTVYRPTAAGAALSVGAGTVVMPRILRARSGSSSAYSVASGARAPPQAAAPVFGVSVTRWRLVNADGIPTSQRGLPMDTWTDRSTDRSSARSFNVSFRTATTLSDSDTAMSAVGGVTSSVPSPLAPDCEQTNASPAVDANGDNVSATASTGPLRVQFELAVRASGRGEMDWWGRSIETPAGGVAAAAGAAGATAAGDWRVWRSAADVLALYDALALRFGQEFCGRVTRPQLRTAKVSPSAAPVPRDKEGHSSSVESPTQTQPNAPHRADISRDARVIGACLRNLLGLRQFLSTAVMEFLAQPTQEYSAPTHLTLGAQGVDDGSSIVDSRSWDGSNGSASDDSGDDGLVAPGAGSGADTGTRPGYGDFQRPFADGNGSSNRKTGVVDDPKAAGEAVAGAALAADYGAWLKRLAVRLRRSTPAGGRFVRLRRIAPSVTGEQVVRWLVTSSGECKGDRASAVRVGQDMVFHGLLTPLCAGYAPSDDQIREDRDLLRSFDDAVGWLFAYAGDALRDPFAPAPATQVSVMTGIGLDVRVTDWIKTSDEQGLHVQFVVRTQVKETHEAWETARRYRDFTQLRKRLLRLGIDVPTAATAEGKDSGAGGPALTFGPALPKKTWRSDKFDKGHLDARRAALEAYLQRAVEAALAAPHLAGNLLMRFLDPDEATLRILAGGNPFAFGAWPRVNHGTSGEEGGGGGTNASDGIIAGAAPSPEKAEQEDFDNLTESLGGFG